MDPSTENKIQLKDRLIDFYNNYKSKIYLSIILLIIILISIALYKINNDRKNNIIAEKFVRAGLLLE